MLYSTDDFIPAMSDMFKTCRDSGSVTMTVKPYDGQDRPEPRNGTPGKWRKQKLTLIRMSNGKRKVSCVVDCESLKTFQVEYCKMLRENMNSLPRRPQNKKKKKSAAN